MPTDADRKICKDCGDVKSLSEFNHSAKRDGGGYYLSSYCKPCRSLRTKAYLADHPRPSRRRRHDGKRVSYSKYGYSDEFYQDLYERQGRACAICQEPRPIEKLWIDHCHETHQVRGLLCPGCNTALGQFKDNLAMVERAAQYLRDSLS